MNGSKNSLKVRDHSLALRSRILFGERESQDLARPDASVSSVESDGELDGRTRIRTAQRRIVPWEVLRPLIEENRLTGPAIHDARIAAICIEHGVSTLWSADRDFSKFAGLKIVNPLRAAK